MNIIGIGNAGTAIAEGFSNHPQYSIYKIDVGLEGVNCFPIKAQKTPEDYEKNVPSFKKFLKDIKGETLLIIGGSGYISAISLRVLQALKDKRETSILYIRPDLALLSQIKRACEKVTYSVLQEYARSGAIKQIYFVDNPTLESIIGEISIIEYFNKINDLIISSFHMISVYRNSQPILGVLSEPGLTRRITTFGVFDIASGKENLFFPLDNISETCYIYAVSESRLREEGGLHRKITSQMRERATNEDIDASFGVFSTNYENDYGYLLAHSELIQP